MKKSSTLSIIALFLLTGFTAQAQVGIGTTTPDTSSALDIVSDSRGVLVPRLTLVQRNMITAPANGLLIYQTDDTPGFYFYTGSQWQRLVNNTEAAGNYVSLNTNQTISGKKTFGADINVQGLTVGKGGGAVISNTALGTGALTSNTSGYYNTAAGYAALGYNTTGYNNTAFGAQSLFINTTGSMNTAVGLWSLYVNTTGAVNAASGYNTLKSNTTGNRNTAHGGFALQANTTGNYNTAVGVQALYNTTTGQSNTALGAFADVTDPAFNNSTAIGAYALVDASNKVQIGDGAITAVKLGGNSAVLETSRIKLTGGSPGANKVLTSDAAGLATWQTPASGGAASRKRSVVLDVAGLDITTAVSTIPGTKKVVGAWTRPVLVLPEGSVTQFQTQMPIPADWNGTSTFTVTVLYSSPSTAGAFSTALLYQTTGLNVSTSSNSNVAFSSAPESATADGLMEVSYSVTAAAAAKILYIGFRRMGQDNLNDTSGSEMQIQGVRIDYFD